MSSILLTEDLGPSAPSGNQYILYFKSDGNLYYKDDTGTEYILDIMRPCKPGGRLTLTALTPVLTTILSGQNIIRYTPHENNVCPIYDGTRFAPTVFSELTQTTTDTTKSPAACTSNVNYDLFVWNDAGTIRCTRGPVWGSTALRGTGAGTTELDRVQGIHVNKFAITNGPAAGRGTYVGTIHTNGSSTVDFVPGNGLSTGATNGLWNKYNRVPFNCAVNESANTYTMQSVTPRSMNSSTTNRLNIITGLEEDGFVVSVYGACTINANGEGGYVGIGLDVTASFSALQGNMRTITDLTIGKNVNLHCTANGTQMGFHFYQAVERCTAAVAAVTFFGDNNNPPNEVQAGITGQFMF